MPLINYSVLAKLVHEHQQLVSAAPLDSARQSRLEDLLYTLGVYTGFRDPVAAVTEARRLLDARRLLETRPGGGLAESAPAQPA